MEIQILAVGKRHESWVKDGIDRYEKRLRKPFNVKWNFLAHSQRDGESARVEESSRILDRIKERDTVVLLDERGKIMSSVEWAKTLQKSLDTSGRVVIIIGGAYGVDDRVRARAQTVWSLSKLVFPHQLVRLVLVEQVYRAQEILAGGGYHHE